MAEQDGGLIGAEEKVINSKNKMDENMVSRLSLALHTSFCTVGQVFCQSPLADDRGAATPTDFR